MHPELTRIAVEDRQARLRADYAASRRDAAALRAFVLRLRRVLGRALVDAGIRIAAGRIDSHALLRTRIAARSFSTNGTWASIGRRRPRR